MIGVIDLRKLWMVLLLMVMAIPYWIGQASAAQVTDVHWVTRNDAPIPFVRMVLSLSSPVEASAAIDATGTTTTVTLKKATIMGAPKEVIMDKSIASKANLVQNGANTDVRIVTPKSIDVSDIKVFTLKKDTVNNKPYRMVIDIQQKGVAPREHYYGKPKPVAPKPVEPKVKPKAPQKPAPVTAPKKVKAVTPPPLKLSASTPYRVGGGIKGKVIVIDPGHGGSDPGAIGPTGLQEKQVTLPVSEYLKRALEAKGAKVVLTRTTDVDVHGPHASGPDELQARVNVANYNNADAFVSVHINSFTNPAVGGIATYYYESSQHGAKLAKAMQKHIGDHPGFGGDRGTNPVDFYVLRHSEMPSILVELGFLSNPKEEKLLKEDSTKKAFADEMVAGFVEYFGG